MDKSSVAGPVSPFVGPFLGVVFRVDSLCLKRASWRRAWSHVIPFFAFPPAVRRVVYTTNSIESVHARLRKITSEWSRAAHDWKQAMNQFSNLYAERFSIRG